MREPLRRPAAEQLTAYVGVGSNIQPSMNIVRAVDRMAEAGRITGVSTFYRTTAIGPEGAPDFYNGVVRAEFEGGPEHVARELDEIERALGRRRTGDAFAPRVIDLDLLLWRGTPGPTASHPDVLTRSFVALPLLELAPRLVLPEGRPLADVAGNLAVPGEPLPSLTARLRDRIRR